MSQEPKKRAKRIVKEPPAEEGLDFSLRAATAPPGSLWARQEGADFFLPPPLTIDTIRYLDPDVDPETGVRNIFSLKASDERGEQEDD
jgi:hypothetical protein